jgi:NAD(P)-dependent dehydrogenase (short-subunit alcohol dehydrogenase family)
MDMRLHGKIVVVTGGSKGIGYACAEAFAAEGARCALVSRSQANLDAAIARFPDATHPPVLFAADMTRADATEGMVAAVEQQLGAIDILVNSAGAARRYAPADLDAESWHDAMNAKFFSTIHPTDAVLRRMIARKRGVIVNIIGMGGKVASPVHLPGGAANAALMLATTGLAAAYASSGIRVNGINPGGTLTGRVQEGLKAEAKLTGLAQEELLARNQAKIPLGRFARPEEIAAVAVFLASAQASYVTGAIVSMDGGASAVI